MDTDNSANNAERLTNGLPSVLLRGGVMRRQSENEIINEKQNIK